MEQPKILEIHFKDKLYGGHQTSFIVSWNGSFWFTPMSTDFKCYFCPGGKRNYYFMFTCPDSIQNEGLLSCPNHYQDSVSHFKGHSISSLPLKLFKILSFEE